MVQHAIGLNIGSVLARTFGYWTRNLVPFSLMALLLQSPVLLLALLMPLETPTQAYLFGVVIGFGPMVISLLTASVVAYGVFQQIRGRTASMGDCLRIGLSRLFPVIGVGLLVALATLAGLMLLIVPGIIVACIFYVAVPVATVESPGERASLGRSAYLTKGARAAIFGVAVILGLITSVANLIVKALIPEPTKPDSVVAHVNPGASQEQAASYARDLLASLRVESVITTAVGAVLGCLLAIASVVVYYDLRVQKEQVDVEKIVEVFS